MATRRIDPTFVELTRTKPYLGGHRWWLLCPACGARVRIIYARWATTGWGCRACMGLSYRSRRFHRGWAYENITVVIARVERLKGDLASRSPRRKLRALCKLHPQSTFVALRDFVKRRKTELAAERRAGRA